jgi:class 3 adenylate cyclase
MREMDTGPVLDANVLPQLRARRGAAVRGGRAQPMCAAGYVPFAGGAPSEMDTREYGRGEIEGMLSALEEFVDGDPLTVRRGARVLATVLFTDIVDSTQRAAALGDRAWSEVLDRHDQIARETVRRCDGRLVKGTGDGVLATFGSPAHGIECARALRAALSHAGIPIRAGVHTGEVEMRGEDVSGIGVHIAARVAALAGAGELLVSRTVRDLVAGAGYDFISLGAHVLRGVPDSWELLSVR